MPMSPIHEQMREAALRHEFEKSLVYARKLKTKAEKFSFCYKFFSDMLAAGYLDDRTVGTVFVLFAHTFKFTEAELTELDDYIAEQAQAADILLQTFFLEGFSAADYE